MDKTENLYTPGCIRTVSGKYVNIFDPHPDTIDINDIAHALAHMPRFGGHLPVFYSVAQHSVEVAEHLPDRTKLQGLLHDASEAYLIDLPSPIKERFPFYKEVENNIMLVIADKFGFNWPLNNVVKTADKVQLEAEWHYLMLNQKWQRPIYPLPSLKAKWLFQEKFEEYKN